ncbi:MAG: hypothetical protein M3H12_21005, partial [Chromatiales bacterium]
DASRDIFDGAGYASGSNNITPKSGIGVYVSRLWQRHPNGGCFRPQPYPPVGLPLSMNGTIEAAPVSTVSFCQGNARATHGRALTLCQ